MRPLTAVVVGVILVASIQPALAFRNISSVDGWDADRLREAGISVCAWKHPLQTEDPPLEWVQVTFDCSPFPQKQEVLMTAWIISDRQTVTALRAERNRQSKDTVSLLFYVQPECRPQSHLDIFVWMDTPDGGKEARGYSLSVKRIMELSREETANKGILASVRGAAEKSTSVSGIVTDESGKPLSGVSWWISGFEEWRDGTWENVLRTGGTRKHMTDENGRFEVTFHEKVRYDLQFDKLGYAPAFVFQVSPDSPELHVKMKKGVLVTGEVEIKGQNRPDFEGITVALRLPNPRGLWFKRTTLVDHEGKFRFYAGPPPTPPGDYCKWQLVCAGEIVMLDVREDTPADEVIFQISTTSKKKSPTGKGS